MSEDAFSSDLRVGALPIRRRRGGVWQFRFVLGMWGNELCLWLLASQLTDIYGEFLVAMDPAAEEI